ncbi:MAG: hypothetical protein ACJAY7_001324 [Pseudohongiellaceae bacterium]|jgi:uncharacterized protein (DUF3820 family)
MARVKGDAYYGQRVVVDLPTRFLIAVMREGLPG